jgi:protein-disulfide isomerase
LPPKQERPLSISRRQFCQQTSMLVFGAALAGTVPFSLAQAADPQGSVPEADLMKPDALPDRVMGDANAPVTIVEYASMTCPHCAHFQETTFPELKKAYIDTGKAKYMLREFPLDDLAAAAFMLARCAGELDSSRYYALVDTLFAKQNTWAVQQPIPPLMAIAKQAGFSEQSFNACLNNQKLLDNIEAVRERAVKQFQVNSTPTFFINGQKYVGALSFDDVKKAIDPLLAKKS